jgi:hypothetical protein
MADDSDDYGDDDFEDFEDDGKSMSTSKKAAAAAAAGAPAASAAAAAAATATAAEAAVAAAPAAKAEEPEPEKEEPYVVAQFCKSPAPANAQPGGVKQMGSQASGPWVPQMRFFLRKHTAGVNDCAAGACVHVPGVHARTRGKAQRACEPSEPRK